MRQLELLEKRIALTAQMVMDFNSADLGINPAFITPFRDEIYFTSNPGKTQFAELWKSDGTLEGTQHIADMGEGRVLGLEAQADQLVAVVQRELDFFSHRINDLYASDGTKSGTRRIAEDSAR